MFVSRSVRAALLLCVLISSGALTSHAASRDTGSAQTGGYLAAWGRMAGGVLGTGYPLCCPIRPFPMPVLSLQHVISMAIGNDYALAVENDGSVWAWGSSRRNEFGTTGGGIVYRPQRVPGISTAVSVATGAERTIALRKDGTVWEWGNRTDGSVGGPTPIGGLLHIHQIAAYQYYFLALRSDGTVWQWGNLSGPGSTPIASPEQVQGLGNISQVAIGLDHAMAVTRAGTVFAWGDNRAGQLGHPGLTQSASPVAVLGPDGKTPLDKVTQVAAGINHSVALKRDGTVWAWGAAPGSPTARSLPGSVAGVTGVIQVTAGVGNTLALVRDGTVIGWGRNDLGQLGVGTRNVGGCSCIRNPTVIGGLHGASSVATAQQNTMAVVGTQVKGRKPGPSRVCARPATGGGNFLTGAHLAAIGVDTETGHLFVMAPGGYDIKTGDPVCTTGVVTLDGWSGKILQSTGVARATIVSGTNSMAVDSQAGRVVAAVWGDVQVPGSVGTTALLNTAGRYLLALNAGQQPSTVAVDQVRGRAFVAAFAGSPRRPVTAVIDGAFGRVLKTVPTGAERILVDGTTGRAFLIASDTVTVVDSSTGAVIKTLTLPPGRRVGADIDERTSRLFISEIGEAPHEQTAPPNTITVVDTRTGSLVRTLSSDRDKFTAGNLFVDPPMGIAVTAAGSPATILDARTGAIRRQITLPKPGLVSPGAVDPSNGNIFSFATHAFIEIDPHTWKIVRRIPDQSNSNLALVPNLKTGRMYALQSQKGGNAVRSFCLKPSCS